MTRYYNLTVLYKHCEDGDTFSEVFPCVTGSIVEGVKNRFEKEYDEGEITSLKFVCEVTQ